uniref:PTS sugar transporter subunit IIA n=1 Tax=Ligilactobacillus sp. TaxID=2767921 RepID=UPI002FE0B45C
GAVSNGVVGQIAILAGMTTGATASSITAAGRMHFKLMMFAVPAVMLVIAIIIFMKKITLTEERHAQIVAELERTWGKDLGVSGKAASTEEKITVKAPVSGTLIELSEVNDDVFSKGQAGSGFAIRPDDGRVYAPFDATVRQVFSTRHAVGIVADNGMALLIHVGLGTVALKGTGFVTYIEEGQKIRQGDEILEFWDESIRKAGLDDTVIVTVTNSGQFEDFRLKEESGSEIKAMDDIMELKLKKVK